MITPDELKRLREVGKAIKRHVDFEFYTEARNNWDRLLDEIERQREALKKIYEYRSDDPDWNMVMAIAGDAINPMEMTHD